MLEQLVKTGLRIQHKRAFLARQTNFYNVHFKSSRNASSQDQKANDDDDMNKPLKYSTSPAATWRAEKSRNPLADRHPRESDVITISLAVFMLYFFVFREENDIDTIFDMDLKDHLPNLDMKAVSYPK
ncbi:hypothetical protein KPH14_005639 [Odynerus spinipes]|uniref:Uncharacterized protein n=1 Tax=Odynerus spinipes TaxID=1348599 RepID=A0AAD9VIW1_9HYME|nr:hypothetical protein KPH14_005639 [Odynerus spinipes]